LITLHKHTGTKKVYSLPHIDRSWSVCLILKQGNTYKWEQQEPMFYRLPIRKTEDDKFEENSG